MPLDLRFAFVTASVLVTLVPGPSMLLVLGDALEQGSRPALVTALGVVAGDAILLVLSLLGVGAVLAASATAFVALKWAGATFLIYLGIRQWRSAAAPPAQHARAPRSGGRRFATGLVVTLLNPKIIAFFVAFFPQFVAPDGGARQLVILGATFLAVVAGVLTGYALMAGMLRGALTSSRGARLLARVSGATLIGAGIAALSLRRA